MKFYILSLLAFISLSYCANKIDKQITVTVFNNTAYHIDSIRITSYGANTLIQDILPGKKVEKSFKMTYTGNYEGAFLMLVHAKEPKKDTAFTFGYYSGSNDIRSNFSFEFYDSLQIK